MSEAKSSSIRDLYEECMTPTGATAAYVSTNHLLAVLGINPDMSAKTLREDLAVGRRARELNLAFEGMWWCGCGDGVDLDDDCWKQHGRCANCVASTE